MNPDPKVTPDEQVSVTPETVVEPAQDIENVEVTTNPEVEAPVSEAIVDPAREVTTVDTSEQESLPVAEPVTVTIEPTTPTAGAEVLAIENMPAEAETEPQVVSVPSEPLATGAASPKSKKKRFVLLAVVLGALLVLGGSAFAVYALWYNNPQKVVSDAFVKLLNAKDISLDGDLVGESSSAKTAFKFSLLANNEKATGSLQFDYTQSDISATVKAQMASEKDKVYIKLEALQEALNSVYGEELAEQMQQYFGTLLDKIDGKWVVITADDLNDFTKTDSSKETVCVQEEMGKIQNDNAKRSELTKLLNDNFFIDITDKGTESIEGVQSNHYILEFNKETYKAFLTGLKETSVFKAVDGCVEADMAKQLDDSVASLEKSTTNSKQEQTFELWVSTWSHEIVKFSVSASNATTGTTQKLNLLPKINTNPQVTMPTADTTVDDIKTEVESLMSQLQSAYSNSVVTPASSNTYTTQYY